MSPVHIGKLRSEKVPDLDQEHRLQERGWHGSGDPGSGDQCPDPLFSPCGVQVGFSARVRASPSGLEVMPLPGRGEGFSYIGWASQGLHRWCPLWCVPMSETQTSRLVISHKARIYLLTISRQPYLT